MPVIREPESRPRLDRAVVIGAIAVGVTVWLAVLSGMMLMHMNEMPACP
jgi:hypothetical protein